MAGGFVNTYAFTWLQRRAEPAVLGRVMSLVMLSSLGLAPLSLIVAGLLASQPALLFGGAAAMMVAGAVGAALSPTFRRL